MSEINKKKAAFHNLGCKVNAYETEAMQQQLEAAGYEIVPFAPGADVYIINTCSVTNIADRKSRQMLHRAKKMNPEAIIVAAGCYVQTAMEKTGLDVEANIILGNNKKKDLLDILRQYEKNRTQIMEESAEDAGAGKASERTGVETDAGNASESAEKVVTGTGKTTDSTGNGGVVRELVDINHTSEYEALSIRKTNEHTRAYIKVQDGCNQFCSYCIIPYARGRARSREEEDILKELKTLARSGVREVVLTGIHLSSYGKDRDTDLLHLIRRVHEIEGIDRIRLGSLEPGIITEEFAEGLLELPKFCPHFHLSLQSGCDGVLKRMNRKYTAEEFYEKTCLLRNRFDQPALTTDIIVGFPGETEAEFEETESFLKKVRFYETHVFKYSMRKGTRAAQMEDQVPEEVKTVRSDRLLELNRIHKDVFEESWAGKPCEVLFEEKHTLEGKEYFSGYTKEYIRAVILADRDYSNQVIAGRMRRDRLTGRLVLERQGA